MFPATVWMEAAISSIEVDVSSAAWAWLCAPWVMSFALVEICPAEDATCTEVSWMLSTIRRRFATMSLKLWAREPSSSSDCDVQALREVALGHRGRDLHHLAHGGDPAPGEQPPDGGPAGEQQQGEQPGLQEDLALLGGHERLADRDLHPALLLLGGAGLARGGQPELGGHVVPAGAWSPARGRG